jgi:hypothetical protein
MFMDLIWAQWAQDQLLTCSGGAGTRMRHYGYAPMSDLAIFLLGGPGSGSSGYFQLLSDYQWPRAVWEMMLDRRGKGEYAYLSRKPNEEQDVWPRPAGTEFSMVIRPDSRLARSSWITPDYVLGVRMDHPAAMYCHLSGSTQGMIFATTPDAFIRFHAGYHRAVQDRGVVVLQQKENWLSRHPEWFPGWTASPGPVSVESARDSSASWKKTAGCSSRRAMPSPPFASCRRSRSRKTNPCSAIRKALLCSPPPESANSAFAV